MKKRNILKAAKREGYRWVYEKADLEQGALYLTDTNGEKIVCILPDNREKPIDHWKGNARVCFRDGNEDKDNWYEVEREKPFKFEKALGHGEISASFYKHQFHKAKTAFELAQGYRGPEHKVKVTAEYKEVLKKLGQSKVIDRKKVEKKSEGKEQEKAKEQETDILAKPRTRRSKAREQERGKERDR